jgi:hypothetical protein
MFICQALAKAAARPLAAVLAMCCLYRSSQSITTPKILAFSVGLTVSPLVVNGVSEDRSLFLVKCMIAVLLLAADNNGGGEGRLINRF